MKKRSERSRNRLLKKQTKKEAMIDAEKRRNEIKQLAELGVCPHCNGEVLRGASWYKCIDCTFKYKISRLYMSIPQ